MRIRPVLLLLVLPLAAGTMVPNPPSGRVTTLAVEDAAAAEPAPTTTTQQAATTPPDGATETVDDDPSPRDEVLISEHLDAVMAGWLAHEPAVRGVAAAVSFTGDTDPLWIGSAAPPGAEPPDHGAGYPVLSVTKTFTEALVLRQVAAGRLDLDGPVPAVAGVVVGPHATAITPRMLLQHTSGLVNYPHAVGYDAASDITPENAVALALASPLVHPPGTALQYSNTNYHWLGLVLESLSGRSYADLVAGLAREHGLTETWLDPAGRPGWVGYASGGIRSTVGDVARWGAALFTPDEVLPGDELAALLRVGPLGVGLGLFQFCPCCPCEDDTSAHDAMGQIAADGGLFYFASDDVVIAVRIAMAPEVDLAPNDRLAFALRDAVAAASQGGLGSGPNRLRW